MAKIDNDLKLWQNNLATVEIQKAQQSKELTDLMKSFYEQAALLMRRDPVVPRKVSLFTPDDPAQDIKPDFEWPIKQLILDQNVKMQTLETWWSDNLWNEEYTLTKVKVTLSDGVASDEIECGGEPDHSDMKSFSFSESTKVSKIGFTFSQKFITGIYLLA